MGLWLPLLSPKLGGQGSSLGRSVGPLLKVLISKEKELPLH